MKKLVVILLILTLMLGTAVIPSYAKSEADIIKELISSDAVFETFAELGAVVESGDGMDIFLKVTDVYPIWLNQIRAIKSGTSYSYTSDSTEKVSSDIVKDALDNQKIFDAFARLVQAESTGDNAKIYLCVIEIYPVFVEALDDSIKENKGVATTLSEGNLEIVYGIVGLAVGFLSAWLIFRRKIAALSSTTTDDKFSAN